MTRHSEISSHELRQALKSGMYALAGNARLKIYGLLTCTSGKRILKKNRIFFKNKTEAVQLGYRPCGHCLADDYQEWKELTNSSYATNNPKHRGSQE
ncbi:MAG: Ada metal-binding domain-containing protein [Cyclobacteriaceae bacterium]